MWKKTTKTVSQKDESKPTVRHWLLVTFIPGLELVWNAASEISEKAQAAIDLLGWIFV